jgi:hypothetical protein
MSIKLLSKLSSKELSLFKILSIAEEYLGDLKTSLSATKLEKSNVSEPITS